jgi:hypothetical protein
VYDCVTGIFECHRNNIVVPSDLHATKNSTDRLIDLCRHGVIAVIDTSFPLPYIFSPSPPRDNHERYKHPDEVPKYMTKLFGPSSHVFSVTIVELQILSSFVCSPALDIEPSTNPIDAPRRYDRNSYVGRRTDRSDNEDAIDVPSCRQGFGP